MNEGIPPILIRYKISRKILQKLPKSRIFYHFKSVNIIFLPRSTYDIDNETKGELITKRKKKYPNKKKVPKRPHLKKKFMSS